MRRFPRAIFLKTHSLATFKGPRTQNIRLVSTVLNQNATSYSDQLEKKHGVSARRLSQVVAETEHYPTLEEVDKMPLSYKDLSGDMLFVLCKQDDFEARCERLRREIMRIDRVSWQDAGKVVHEMDKKNDEGAAIIKLPYQLGIGFGLAAAFTAVPMVFHLDTVMWFNETFVGEDVPPFEDIDDPLQVGSWAWNWMEPFHGTMSFVLLGFQFARAQMKKIEYTTYTKYMRTRRAERLCALYPKYEKDVVFDFAYLDGYD